MKVKRFLRLVVIVLSALGYAVTLAGIGWMTYLNWYGQPAQTASSVGAARDRLVQEILDGQYDGAFWEGLPSIEEAWPEVVAAQRVPYYYTELEDAAKLCDELGYLDHPARLRPYSELTETERLMLARRVLHVDGMDYADYADDPLEDWTLLDLLRDAGEALWHGKIGGAEVQQRAIVKLLLRDALKYGFELGAEDIEVTRKGVAARVASPISGRIIAAYQEEFSPGDAYCEVITDEAQLSEMRAKDKFLRERYYPWAWELRYYVYFRIYGEQDVIAEGLMRKRKESS